MTSMLKAYANIARKAANGEWTSSADAQGARRVLKQMSDLILGKGSAASDPIQPSRLRSVFCDASGRLYWVDPLTGDYAPIPRPQ